MFRCAAARSFQAAVAGRLPRKFPNLRETALPHLPGTSRSVARLAGATFHALALLILTLWLLLDVLLVVALAGARHLYVAWWRMRAERIARLARTSL